MLKSPIENGMRHNFIDYKQPVNVIENDFRTASYLGHRRYHQNDFTVPPSKNSVISPRYVLHQKEMRYSFTSEHVSQYNRKYNNCYAANAANLYMCSSKPAFATSTERRIFNSPPKPIGISSSQARDYTHGMQGHNDYVTLNRMHPTAPPIGKSTKYFGVNLEDQWCYTYDSTSMDVYKAPKGDHIPPGCKQPTITLWNYSQPSKYQPSKCSYQKIVRNKPQILKHNGMKSKNQSTFIYPIPRKFNCDDQLRT